MQRNHAIITAGLSGAIAIAALTACGSSSQPAATPATTAPAAPAKILNVTDPNGIQCPALSTNGYCPGGGPIIIMTASQLDTAIKNGGDWTNSDESIKSRIDSVQCVADGADILGVGKYQCLIYQTIDKSTNSYSPVGTKVSGSREIIVGTDGSWVTSNN